MLMATEGDVVAAGAEAQAAGALQKAAPNGAYGTGDDQDLGRQKTHLYPDEWSCCRQKVGPQHTWCCCFRESLACPFPLPRSAHPDRPPPAPRRPAI